MTAERTACTDAGFYLPESSLPAAGRALAHRARSRLQQANSFAGTATAHCAPGHYQELRCEPGR